MNPEVVIPPALIYLMAAALVVSAAAMVVQALLLLGVYRSSVATKEQVTAIAGHAESLVQSVQRAVDQTRQQWSEVSAKATEVLNLTRTQLVRVDEVLAEAVTRARVQMDRVELVVDDTVSRLHETAAVIHNGVLKPIRELNGVAAGLRAALDYLFRGRRITVEKATHDEEMFI